MLQAGICPIGVVIECSIRVQEGCRGVVVSVLDHSADQSICWVALLWEEDIDGVARKRRLGVSHPIGCMAVQVFEVYPAHLADVGLHPECD